MRTHTSLAAGAAALALALAGCGAPAPGASGSVVPVSTPDRGVELDSKDIVTMAGQMAASLARCSHIASNPKQPVTMVMKEIKNETTTIRYLNRISLAKVRAELNRAIPRSRILFVVERADLERLKRLEGVSDPDEVADADPRVKPDYALMGRFLDHPSRGGVYYLCTFQAVHISSGAIVWEDSYEVKRVP